MSLPSRVGAVGAGFVLIAGASGAAAIALTHPDRHAPTAQIASPATGSARPVSDSTPDAAKHVYDHAKDSVAFISSQTGEGQATGSGFVVSSDGKIITNEHVVDGAQSVTVKLGTNGAAQPARVLAADASKDLALLQVSSDGRALHPLKLADSSKLQVGQSTYAIGNPYGLDHTFTSGIVSALNRQIQAPDGTPIEHAIQTDAAINPGNSGGALLDSDGNVIGVNSQIASTGGGDGGQAGNVGIGFAIASDTVADFLAHPTSSGGTQAAPDQQSQPAPDGTQADPYGQQADPYGQQQADPYGQQQADPYGSETSPDGSLVY